VHLPIWPEDEFVEKDQGHKNRVSKSIPPFYAVHVCSQLQVDGRGTCVKKASHGKNYDCHPHSRGRKEIFPAKRSISCRLIMIRGKAIQLKGSNKVNEILSKREIEILKIDRKEYSNTEIAKNCSECQSG